MSTYKYNTDKWTAVGIGNRIEEFHSVIFPYGPYIPISAGSLAGRLVTEDDDFLVLAPIPQAAGARPISEAHPDAGETEAFANETPEQCMRRLHEKYRACGDAYPEQMDPPTYIPQDDAARKAAPMYRGLLGYFPAALFAVAAHSMAADKKHNPGATDGPTWARGKSSDHADCIIRHMIDAGKPGEPDREYHLTAIAWRALAMLQEEMERTGYSPGVSSRFNREATK
jgi:hypothetical protein